MAKHAGKNEESETLLVPATAGSAGAAAAPPAPAGFAARLRQARIAPFVQLLAYYALLIAALVLLARFFPAVRDALLSADVLRRQSAPLEAGLEGNWSSPSHFGHGLDRSLTTLLIIVAAMTLIVPVVRVYMLTKRFRYDPALVRSVVILPIVVAGIVMVVRNSVALAFSLAGIVAAVRFRNTLKDPRDAVYIFLVLGIGLSAGVQALDVALVMSLAFNFVVLFLWRYNVGSIYSGRYGRTGIPSVGDSSLLLAQEPPAQREIRRRFLDDDHGIRADGILLVHTAQPDLARATVGEALGDMARDWALADVTAREDGAATLYYVLRLRKATTPPDLVGALDERWSSQVSAAEYVPFRRRKKKRK